MPDKLGLFARAARLLTGSPASPAATDADRLDRLYQAAGGPKFETVRTGPELTRKLLGVIESRGHSYTVGLPGIGKTHCSMEALKAAVEKGTLRRWTLETATKDLSGEKLFEPVLRIDAKSDKYISIDPAMIVRLVGEEALIPQTNDMTREKAIDIWEKMGNVWCAILLDEITRAAAQFVDHLLPIMEFFLIVLDGKPYYCPIVWMFAGNPPGMDSTASALTPAFYSRLALRVNLLDVDLDFQTDGITGPRAHQHAERGHFGIESRVNPDWVRLAAAIRYLLWGTPTDRKGCAWLPDDIIRLINDAAALDPDLAFAMAKLGEIQHFGPDSRRVTALILNAQADAAAKKQQFATEHILRAIQDTMPLGGKDTFSEGHRPDLMVLKKKAQLVVAHKALTTDAVRTRLLLRTAARDLAAALAPRLLVAATPADIDLLTAQIADRRTRLADSLHPATAERNEAFIEALNQIAAVVDDPVDPADAVGKAAAPLLTDDRLATEADRGFFAAMRDEPTFGPRLTTVGQAVAGLAGRPVAVAEQVRTAVSALPWFNHPGNAVLRDTFVTLLQANPDAEPRLSDIARTFEKLLAGDSDDAAVLAALRDWEQTFRGKTDEAAVRPVFDGLGGVLGNQHRPRFTRFRNLWEAREGD